MAEEVLLPMQLTIQEAAVIKFIRESRPFSNITIVKRNGEIERTTKEESQTIKDLETHFGLTIEQVKINVLDKGTTNGIVEE